MASFQRTGIGIKPVNAYLLAKLSELVYCDNLDYQIRYLRNGQQPLDYASSDAVKRDGVVTNENIEKAIAARCFHWFVDEQTRPKRPALPVYVDSTRFQLVNIERDTKLELNKELREAQISQPVTNNKDLAVPPPGDQIRPVSDFPSALSGKAAPPTAGSTSAEQRYQDKLKQYLRDSAKWEKDNYPVFRFLWRNLTVGLRLFDNNVPVLAWDPELMVISQKDLVIICFRGTDGGLGTPPGEMDMGEWLGSNLMAGQTKVESGPFANTWIHTGFLGAFGFIEPDITRYLESINALGERKKIWVTGHSLGGAMAQLTSTYLSRKGYNVQGVYTYASPRVVGNGDFVRMQNNEHGRRFQRFEYYLDPVTMVYAPAYSIGGHRNWVDHKDKGCSSGDNCYVQHSDIAERYVSLNPCEFNRCPTDTRSAETVRLARDMKSGMLSDHPVRMMDHSVQWYVKSMWHQLTGAQQNVLPRVNDSWPFLYVSGPK